MTETTLRALLDTHSPIYTNCDLCGSHVSCTCSYGDDLPEGDWNDHFIAMARAIGAI